ncbi:helix-turn-helix domain-containing protein [Chryseobacterium joostei]|uniref:helix-turn-helix domain-containing protein n=1 Tax=Chryseobacterium joostei TaxID=112234 RepID=UPI003D0EDDC9
MVREESYSEFTDVSEDSKQYIKPTDSINEDTELFILAELTKFEDNLRFTHKDVTLGNLAADFGTNVKYLSAIIKEHKGENFKSYISNLRINYIINMIKNDSSYRKYKISYLAEITGFLSASSFTKKFKEIMGVTPSLYFEQLPEDEK